MKLSKRTNTIILWLISIGLLVSMVIAFTPTLGGLFGGGGHTGPGGQGGDTPALFVNGQAVNEIEVARARQTPPFHLNLEGEAADDIQLLLLDSLIQGAVVEQAAAKTRVTNAEVREAVNDFRTSQNVAGGRNDQAYLGLIGRLGFDDASFRSYWRNQLRQEKYQEELTEAIEVSEEEITAYYELNQDSYQSEERIRARQIVLEDEETANDILARLNNDEDFASLAEEFSSQLADRGGALGAPEGSKEPQAVGRAAFPSQVAEAAFGLQGEGLTDIISVGERFYIVGVEEHLPASLQALEDVRADVQNDALETKQQGELERTVTELVANADVSFPEDSIYSYDDGVIAKVGDVDIKSSELVRAVYLSPNIRESLNSETAQLITSLFKPSVLEQLIQSELAFQGAQDLEQNFFGSKGQIAQSALSYISRDVTVEDDELSSYYQENIAEFTTPASALVNRVDFTSEESARNFRNAILASTALEEALETHTGTLRDLGTIRPGEVQAEIDSALFGTDAFQSLPDSAEEISDILVITETPDPVELEDTTVEEEEAASESEDSAETASESNEETASEPSDPAADETTEETTAENGEAVEEAPVEEAVEEAPTEPEVSSSEPKEVYVVLLATRTPEEVRDFENVRSQVETTVLQSKRSELQNAWLEGLREDISVENLLQAQRDAPDSEPVPEDESVIDDSTETSEEATSEDTTEEAPSTEEATEETTEETSSEETPAETSEDMPSEDTPSEDTPSPEDSEN